MYATRVVNMRLDSFDVYIGRSGRSYSGFFGNPHVVSLRCPVCKTIGHDRGKAIRLFVDYFKSRVIDDPEFKKRVLELRGKRLGCFCARQGGITGADTPFVCHGQVYAAFLDELPPFDEPAKEISLG